MMIAMQTYSQKLARLLSRRQSITIIVVTVIALLMRVLCFPFESRDYQIYLQPWFEEIKSNGGVLAIGRQIGDYLPPYIYILAALSYLPVGSLVSIKIISCFGDIIMACYAAKMVKLITRKNSTATITYCATMLLPTVVLNSGLWGQCDSLYTAALVACVYYLMNDRPRAGMMAFSIAFVFKLQAVFLAPFIILLFIKKRIKFIQLFYVPAVYFLAILPAWIAGRDIVDLLTVYIRLAGSYTKLSLNAPNLYALFPMEWIPNIGMRCVLVVAFIMLLVFYWVWRTDFMVSKDILFRFAMLCALALPYILPHMHERYFYLADVLAVAYAVTYSTRWVVPLIAVSSSFLVYGMYLFGFSWMDAAYAAVPMGYIVGLVCLDVIKNIRASKVHFSIASNAYKSVILQSK